MTFKPEDAERARQMREAEEQAIRMPESLDQAIESLNYCIDYDRDLTPEAMPALLGLVRASVESFVGELLTQAERHDDALLPLCRLLDTFNREAWLQRRWGANASPPPEGGKP